MGKSKECSLNVYIGQYGTKEAEGSTSAAPFEHQYSFVKVKHCQLFLKQDSGLSGQIDHIPSEGSTIAPHQASLVGIMSETTTNNAQAIEAMKSSIPVIVCGKSFQVGEVVTKLIQPEFEGTKLKVSYLKAHRCTEHTLF